MASYKERVRSSTQADELQVSSRFVHLDGSVTTPITIVPSTKGCSLAGVILNTNGNTLLLRSGSRVVAQIAADAPEGQFLYGVYCENGLIAECGGAISATVKFG